jgi:BclB C-terminal domain-containing protein
MGIQISNGAIIPFASGTAFNVSTNQLGNTFFSATIGFGANGTGFISEDTFVINPSALSSNVAFPVPRNGTITDFSAFYSYFGPSNENSEIDFDVTVTVHAQMFAALPGTDTFQALPDTLITFDTGITRNTPVGTTMHGIITDLSIPIVEETRLLTVFFSTSTSTNQLSSLETDIRGFGSAGINIL